MALQSNFNLTSLVLGRGVTEELPAIQDLLKRNQKMYAQKTRRREPRTNSKPKWHPRRWKKKLQPSFTSSSSSSASSSSSTSTSTSTSRNKKKWIPKIGGLP